jgi:hypothetical protein
MGASHIDSQRLDMGNGPDSSRLLEAMAMQLQEAGEEDLCSLLNQVMSGGPYFGSGGDLTEYLWAISFLETKGRIRVREYRIEEGNTVYGGLLVGDRSRLPTSFMFDRAENIWKWRGASRQVVELPDD